MAIVSQNRQNTQTPWFKGFMQRNTLQDNGKYNWKNTMLRCIPKCLPLNQSPAKNNMSLQKEWLEDYLSPIWSAPGCIFFPRKSIKPNELPGSSWPCRAYLCPWRLLLGILLAEDKWWKWWKVSELIFELQNVVPGVDGGWDDSR